MGAAFFDQADNKCQTHTRTTNNSHNCAGIHIDLKND